MAVVTVVVLVVIGIAPIVILWRRGWVRVAVGFLSAAFVVAIAAGIGFVLAEDSPTCDDVCEELYPLALGAVALVALNLAAWLAVLMALVGRRRPR